MALPELAVTGSTGEVGGRVARRLASKGIAQRLVVRDPLKAPVLNGAVGVGASSYGDTAAMTSALEGATTLFLVSGRETEDRLQQHLAAVDAAREAGVETIVYLSFLGAAPNATFTLARQHFATEEHIRDTGASFTFLRSSLYADFVPYFTGPDGVIRGPAGEGRVAWVTRDDIADVAVAVLLSDGHEGRTYEMTGPEAFSMAATAGILSRVTGRPIAYHAETTEEAWASRRPSGAPDWEIEGWITSYAAVATGEMDVVTDAVQEVAGHPPQRLEPFLRAHSELWHHLTDA
ncbi:MAG TPA: SDR family oxidoreductase [Actinomycetota bacterium]|nr:SDR family oxidoreductase [Actinomycetota bacterium]